MDIINKFKRHYLMIDDNMGLVFGCTCGKRGKREVLLEEPDTTFKRVSKRKCPVCKEYKKWTSAKP